MAQDDDNIQEGGIGAGTVTAGLAGAAGASALTTTAINRKLAPVNRGKASSVIDKNVHAAHENTHEHIDARNEALTKRADDVRLAEDAALDRWAKYGSPEAIRSGDPVRIKDSIEQGKRYQKAEEGLRKAEAELRTTRRDLRPTIKEELQQYSERWTRKAKNWFHARKLRKEFLEPRTEAHTIPATDIPHARSEWRKWYRLEKGWTVLGVGFDSNKDLKNYLVWRDEGKKITDPIKIAAHESKKPKKINTLSPKAREELETWCSWYDERMQKARGLNDLEARVTRVIDNHPKVRVLEKEVNKQRGFIAPHLPPVNPLPPTAALPAGTLGPVNPLHAEWTTAVDTVPEVVEARRKLADAERFTRKTSNLEVKRWSRGGATIIEEESGALKKMGQAMSRAFEAKPVLMIAAPAVALGAILALGHLFSSRQQRPAEAPWQNQITQRETRTQQQGNQVPTPG